MGTEQIKDILELCREIAATPSTGIPTIHPPAVLLAATIDDASQLANQTGRPVQSSFGGYFVTVWPVGLMPVKELPVKEPHNG